MPIAGAVASQDGTSASATRRAESDHSPSIRRRAQPARRLRRGPHVRPRGRAGSGVVRGQTGSDAPAARSSAPAGCCAGSAWPAASSPWTPFTPARRPRIVRRRTVVKSGNTTEETVHGVTSLPPERARVRNGKLPRNLACLSNAAIALVRHARTLPAPAPQRTATTPPSRRAARQSSPWSSETRRPEPDGAPPGDARARPPCARAVASGRRRRRVRVPAPLATGHAAVAGPGCGRGGDERARAAQRMWRTASALALWRSDLSSTH